MKKKATRTSKEVKEKPHKCNLCPKSFAIQQQLRNHQKVHTKERPFKCLDSKCTSRFSFKANMMKHYRILHKKELSFECDLCEKAFGTKAELQHHNMRIHDKKKKAIQCVFCDMSFHTSREEQSHILVHIQERPHFCGTCGKEFTVRQTKQQHCRIHKGERIYKCKICSIPFFSSGGLLTHYRKHPEANFPSKEVQCELCKKTYHSKTYMKTHMELVHSKDKLKGSDAGSSE